MSKPYYGFWEERGVIGTRVEIDRKNVTVLWRGAPVLVSGYKASKEDGGVLLTLSDNEERYAPGQKAYATVTKVFYKDETLLFANHYPITGDSSCTLTRTENNRYGNYSIETKSVLPKLRGVWKSDDGYFCLEIKGKQLTINGDTYPICILHSRSSGTPANEFKIVHEDPGVSKEDLTYLGDAIRMIVPICDAPAPFVVIFKKQ